MKNKLAALIMCFVCLVFSIVIPYFLAQTEEKGRYHQHRQATLRPEDEVEDGTFNTHLPLLLIQTQEEIPGEIAIDPVTGGSQKDKYGNTVYTMAKDGSETIHADLQVVDHQKVVNRPTDKPDLVSDIEIRVRGNSSREFEKKNYAIRLKTEDGKDRDEALLGMDAHHEWVLHGPILDKTLLRNYMWYNISGEIMDYAPNVRFCEMMLNGEYSGVYVLTETITAGKDGSRLPLTVSHKGDTFSGYLIRVDRPTGDKEQMLNTFSRYALKHKQGLEIKFPGEKRLTPRMQEDIRQDFSDFEKAIYSYDFDSSRWGYKKLIDIDSFADYLIINELTCNYDAGLFSTYIYKSTDDRFHMCVWDFNSACDNYQAASQQHTQQSFEFEKRLWYFMLTKDADFVDEVISRYEFLRRRYLNIDYLERYMDEVVAYLGPAIERNEKAWKDMYEEDHDMLSPTDRNPRSYEEAIQDMKDFLEERTVWMDANIESLRQYSNASRIKKFNEMAN